MKIDIEKIADGLLDGNTYWVCDYRFNDYMNKPIRLIRPTLVKVVSNEETDKKIYYSESHFRPLNKNGTLSKKIIPVFDNTGYRFRRGTPLQVFDNEKECIEQFKNFILLINAELKKIQINSYERLENEIEANLSMLNELKNQGVSNEN